MILFEGDLVMKRVVQAVAGHSLEASSASAKADPKINATSSSTSSTDLLLMLLLCDINNNKSLPSPPTPQSDLLTAPILLQEATTMSWSRSSEPIPNQNEARANVKQNQ